MKSLCFLHTYTKTPFLNVPNRFIVFLQVERAFAIVISTGAMTAQGQLVRMILFPSPIRFKVTAELPYIMLLAVFWSMRQGFYVKSSCQIGQEVLYMHSWIHSDPRI